MSGTSNRNDGVTADTLFVGITRPALAFGVPYAALLVNSLITLELFLTTRNLLCVLICVPLHGLAWLLCLAEPRFFDLIAVWGSMRCRGGCSLSRDWCARSYGNLHRTGSQSLPVAVVECSRGEACVLR
jgi:type IV secretion system protein VirB3